MRQGIPELWLSVHRVDVQHKHWMFCTVCIYVYIYIYIHTYFNNGEMMGCSGIRNQTHDIWACLKIGYTPQMAIISSKTKDQPPDLRVPHYQRTQVLHRTKLSIVV